MPLFLNCNSCYQFIWIKGTINPPNPHPPPPQNTAALVGGILGGLLGFVLLLGLLILLLCCCCGYRKRGLAGTAVVPPTPAVTTIENTHVAAKSSTLIYPVPYHNISSVHLDQMDSCAAAGAATATTGYLKHQIDVPSINVGTDRCYYDPNINTTVRSVASCRSRPEHYLNILTIHRDVSDGECDDAASMSGSYHHHHHLRQHSSSNLASSHHQQGGPFEIPIINQNNCVTNSRRYDDDYQQQQQYLHHHHHIRQHSASNINTNNNNNDFYLHSYQQQNQEFGQPRYI